MDALGSGMFLAILTKALLDFLAAPFRARWPEIDLWWFDYLALVCGGVVAWFADLNLLADYIPHEALGRILTALLIGGGAKLINDVFANVPPPLAGRTVGQRQGRYRGW